MNRGGIITLFLAFISVVCVVILFFSSFIRLEKTCNDGTIYGECSKIKPYLCSQGILEEKASVCGCSNVSKIEGERCISPYQISPKNITLHYVIRGEKAEINLTVYEKLDFYLSKLPRYIDSSKNPTLLDFKLLFLDEEQQRELLLPLVVAIENRTRSKEDQARIAISIAQEIPFGSSNKTLIIGGNVAEYQRYPYEVLYDMEGICSEKSSLMIFLLRELGYGTASLYYAHENHEAVGIKCPEEYSVDNSGYCFAETTGPSIITDDRTEYLGVTRLTSTPKITNISEGISLGKNLYEYKDAKDLIYIREKMQNYGYINFIQHLRYQKIKDKYGLISWEYSF